MGTQVVGGGPASVGEYPYFVSVQSSAGGTGDAFCGGTLLSTTTVLTAAHCVQSLQPGELQVTVGGTTLVGGDVGAVRNIGAVTVHPGYNPATHENDVAILTLSIPINRNDTSVEWVRLAKGNELGLVDPGDTATVVGHGSTSDGGPPSNALLETGVTINTDAVMSDQSVYGVNFKGATMMGAGPLAGGKGFCQEDDGGPLVSTVPFRDILLGDVSWSAGCAQPGLPGVYGELYQGGLASFVDSQVARPNNDEFTSAITLIGNAGSAGGTNENATLDPNEPGDGTSVWYNWTPTESGNAKVTVNQHLFDSQVTVYTGLSADKVFKLAGNDNANPNTLQSEVEFNAVANTTYRIQVEGKNFDYGTFRLSFGVNRPVNDDLANATPLSGSVSSPLSTNNLRATGQAGEPSQIPAFISADSSLWYSWTAPESGIARFTTAGSSFDTTLAAFTGSTFAGLSQVAVNDDFNGDSRSLISFQVSAGTTYRIQVAGKTGSRGNVRLQFGVKPEANDLFTTAQEITGFGGSVSGSNSRAIGEPAEKNFFNSPDETVWYRFTAPTTGTFVFTTVGSNFDTVLAAATGNSNQNLVLVAVNDDTNGTTSKIQFSATIGTVYYLQVDGFNGGRGNIQLNWTQI